MAYPRLTRTERRRVALLVVLLVLAACTSAWRFSDQICFFCSSKRAGTAVAKSRNEAAFIGDSADPVGSGESSSSSSSGNVGDNSGGEGTRSQSEGSGATSNYDPSLPALAVCLVGGARDLDATGPTITHHLLPSLLPFDLFIHAPLDENAAKISALARAHAMHGDHATTSSSSSSSSSSSTDRRDDSSRSDNNEQQGAAGKMAGAIKGVRVFPVVPVDASLYPGSIIILPWGSPNGVQGILQYFRLIEGCLPLIEREEKTNRAGQPYRWVLRTRLDGYWSAPAPPLSSFIGWAGKGAERREGGAGGGVAEGKEGESMGERAAYVVPYGSNWGGVNDRFGFGRREESVVALSRLAMLDEVNRYRQRIGVKRQMNSEITFKLQLKSRDISVQPATLPFCVLSRRAFPDACSSITVSINASVPLNGAKCQPCHPCAEGKEVEAILNATSPSSDKWLGPVQSGVAFCPGGKGKGKGRSSTDGSWPSDWEEIFRRTVGDELAARQRRIRRRVGEIDTCTRFLEKMRATVSNWDAPSPLALCVRSALGAPTVLGVPHDSFPLFSPLLSPTSRILHLKYTALQAGSATGKAGAGGAAGAAGGAEGGAEGEQAQEGQSWEEAVEKTRPGVRVTRASFADLQLAADLQEIVPVLKVTVHGPTQPIELLSSLASFSLPPLCLLLLRAPPCSPESLRRHSQGEPEALGVPPCAKLLIGWGGNVGLQVERCEVEPNLRCTFFSPKHCATLLRKKKLRL